jgi:hypothetical protein
VKIAAARLYANRHELAAIVAALRAEERAALSAAKAQAAAEAQARRKPRSRPSYAARGHGPQRPRRRRARNPRRRLCPATTPRPF